MTDALFTTGSRRGSVRRSGLSGISGIEWISALVALGYTAALVVFAKRHCYFYGDDYSGFLLTVTKPFGEGLLVPVGGQVVPLARALNFAFFHTVGLDYDAALALLCALHGAGMIYLYRALDLAKRTPLNA